MILQCIDETNEKMLKWPNKRKETENILLKSAFRRVLRLKLSLDELPTTLKVKAAEEVAVNSKHNH